MLPLTAHLTFIDGNQPPMLLLHGAKDNVVKRINLDVSKEKMKQGFVPVKDILKGTFDNIEKMYENVGNTSNSTFVQKRNRVILKLFIKF